MKITDVKATRYTEDTDWVDIGKEFEIVVTEVHTDEGITGISYIPLFVHPSGSIGDVYALLINRNFNNLIKGEDAFANLKIWDLLYRHSTRWGRRGLPLQAISLIDMALWDIKAKALGVPVYKLLGGPIRDRIPCYANTAHHLSPDELAKRAIKYVKEGFTAIKIRGNALLTTTEEATTRVRTVREAVGPDIKLMVDVNGTWDVETAIRMLKLWEPYHIYWLEEPVPPDDTYGFVQVHKVARELGVYLATGEQHGTLYDFRELIEADAVDIIEPDGAYCGGITEFLRIIDLARSYSVMISPHVLQHMHMHLVASFLETMWVEFFMVDNELMSFLLRLFPEPKEALQHRDGMLDLPKGPGFGLKMDPELAEHCRVTES
jgi:D-arabinonate dehydratase